MASMAMPVCGLTGFDQAQENIEDVAAFIRVASRMNRFVRAVFSLVQITKAFNQAVETQHSILQALATPNFQHLTAQQYSESVDKLEHLIRVNEFIISRSRSLDFKPWAKYLSVMESQAEKFAGIAESFRLAADAGFRGYVSELIVAANESESDSKDVDWRDFVASLHD